MPAPLIWLGAGIAALYAGDKIAKVNAVSRERVHYFPGEGKELVKPVNGAIVCCGIYGVFEHTGIWIDGNIVELKGNGLIRGISPSRFMADRSGEYISILCDLNTNPLISAEAENNAINKLFTYSDYHVISNNCHRFVYHCVTGTNKTITSFSELNHHLFHYFQCPLSWQGLQ